MSVKLKYALPLVQMALAAVVLRLKYLFDLTQRGNDSPGHHPAFIVLQFLNLPIGVPLWWTLSYRLSALWFGIVYVAAIGLFWYWIALRIHSCRDRGTLLPFKRAPLRVGADLLLIAMGACFAWVLVYGVIEFPYTLSLPALGWAWLMPTWASSLVWSIGPVVVFGHDLVRCIRGNRARP